MKSLKSKITKSNIIKNARDLEMLEKWVSEEGTVKEVEKVYTASADGWMASNFHSKSDNVGPTLVIIQTTFGKVFGGFTKSNWGGNSSLWVQDTNCFLFSIDLKRKNRLQQSSIYPN